MRDSQGQTRSEDEHPAIRRTTSALVAALFVAVGAAVSVAPAHADPVYDQKFIDYLDKHGLRYKSRTDVSRLSKPFCLDTNLAEKEGWRQTETEEFIMAAIPTYCPRFWK